MNIFKKIGKSIYGAEFYKSLRTEKTGSSVKFYLKYSLLLSIVPAIVWSFIFMPNIKDFLNSENVSKFISIYPEELVLTIKDNKFSTNVTEPYTIALPGEFKIAPYKSADGTEHEGYDNAVVIDTTLESFPSDILKKNKTMAFVTKDSVILEKDGGLQVMLLSEYKDIAYELNKQKVEGWASWIALVLGKLVYGLPLILLIGYFISYSAFLVALFLFALLVWLALAIKKVSGGYMYAYRVTIHAMVLGLLLDIIYFAFTMNTLNWLVLVILSIIVALVNVKKNVVIVVEPVTALVSEVAVN